MKTDFAKYAGMRICVAVSGGRDSMALLHRLLACAGDYGIKVCALNCNHKIRGVASDNDSLFVEDFCARLGVPLLTFVRTGDFDLSEKSARQWRQQCYLKAFENCVLPNGERWLAADAVATAHHMDDNAETVIFNLARGAAVAGLAGIYDREVKGADGKTHKIIHPLISCTRAEIDEYVKANAVPFVDDESNFADGYTRNKLRHNVLPQLEKAVPDAVKAIYRLSRIAAEDEEYFNRLIEEKNVISYKGGCAEICFCEERALFKRAAVKVVKERFLKSDYTAEHAENLYNLQFAENGKKFEFLHLTAYKEEGKIVISADDGENVPYEECKFYEYLSSGESQFGGQYLVFKRDYGGNLTGGRQTKLLKFDLNAVPENAVIRFIKSGDVFQKFGGGTKKLGDYFTDKKVPVRLRGSIPLIAVGNEILVVCGVEISQKVKVEKNSNIIFAECRDYAAKN